MLQDTKKYITCNSKLIFGPVNIRNSLFLHPILPTHFCHRHISAQVVQQLKFLIHGQVGELRFHTTWS